MSTRTASQKVLQSFHARDTLWEIFTEQAKEMECSIDYLINEAMRAYAESHAFLPSGQGTRTSQPAPPPSPGENSDETDANHVKPAELIRNRSSLSSLDMDDEDDLAVLADDDDQDDDLKGLDLEERDSGMPPAPSETAPTLANPSGGIQPARPEPGAVQPPPPPRQTSVPPVPHVPSNLPTPAPPPPIRPHVSMPPAPPRPVVPTPPGPPRAVRVPASSPSAPLIASSIPPAPVAMQTSAVSPIQPGHPVLTMIYQGRKIPIQKDQFIIGRGSKSADLPIKDPNVSRKHAAIIFHNGAYYIKDLGSTNGVEYGNQLVDSKRIDEGDAFSICGHPFHFTYS